MFVEVRPIENRKWHNKKGKDSFAMPKVVEALYDEKTGKLATGLSDEDVDKYSKLLGVDLGDTFDPNNAHPWWSTKPAQIKLENATMILNTDKPMEYIRVKLMKANKFIANSLREYEEGKWPEATHVIYDETEEVSLKATKVQAKQRAYQRLNKMSSDDKINIIQIMSNKSVKGRSPDFLDVELDTILEDNPQEFLKWTDMGKEEVYARASILNAIHRNILTKESGSILYMSEVIGFDLDEAVSWFKNPSNQKIKIAILEKLTK